MWGEGEGKKRELLYSFPFLFPLSLFLVEGKKKGMGNKEPEEEGESTPHLRLDPDTTHSRYSGGLDAALDDESQHFGRRCLVDLDEWANARKEPKTYWGDDYGTFGNQQCTVDDESFVNKDDFLDKLIAEGKLKDRWPHVLHGFHGACKVLAPIWGLRRKILRALLEGRCPRPEDEEFKLWKEHDTKEYFDIWETGDEFEEFYEAFKKVSCSDWATFTRDGESYGGPWEAPEGSEERERAYFICWEDNAKAVWETGYPPAALLYCVAFLCPFRCEGVAQVRDLCKWVLDLPEEKRDVD